MANRSPLESPEKIQDGDHLVQFYHSDDFLAEAVINFIAPALMSGEGAILIATEAHLYLYEKTLQDLGINSSLMRLSGQLLMLDAELTLRSFMVNNIPDPERFHLVVGGAISEMSSKFSGLKAYGEMVNILWGEGNIYGTIALEKLWAELLTGKKFSLLCAYSIDLMCDDKQEIAFNEVCQCHTHLLPAEGIIEGETSKDQLHKIVQFQFLAGLKDKLLNELKLKSLELLIPLTSLKIQLCEIKAMLDNTTCSEQEKEAIIHKCEHQLSRMRNIIEDLSQ
jgi:hypothetical protein